jgi:hypothetical protein
MADHFDVIVGSFLSTAHDEADGFGGIGSGTALCRPVFRK